MFNAGRISIAALVADTVVWRCPSERQAAPRSPRGATSSPSRTSIVSSLASPLTFATHGAVDVSP